MAQSGNGGSSSSGTNSGNVNSAPKSSSSAPKNGTTGEAGVGGGHKDNTSNNNKNPEKSSTTGNSLNDKNTKDSNHENRNPKPSSTNFGEQNDFRKQQNNLTPSSQRDHQEKHGGKNTNDVKNKYLGTSNADNLLNQNKKQPNLDKSPKGLSNLENKNGNKVKNNPFGDTKNPNEKKADNFKKDPTVGQNAAKSGAGDLAKKAGEGSKGTSATANDAKDAVGAGLSGDTDEMMNKTGKALGREGTRAALNTAGAGLGETQAGKFVADKVGEGTEKFLQSELGKLLKYGCSLGCLGWLGIILLFILIPVEIGKRITDIIENIPFVGGLFSEYIQDNLSDKLGMDFSDFEFEDIGQDTDEMEKYAKTKERFFEYTRGLWTELEADEERTTYKWDEFPKTTAKEELRVTKTFDPNAMISDYLPLYKIFAGLETVDKGLLARELENYFFTNADDLFKFEMKENITVTYDTWPREITKFDPDTLEFYTDIEYQQVKIVTQTPVLIVTKATTLTEVLTWQPIKHTDDPDGSVRWEQGSATSTPNTEVYAMFNRYSWSKDEETTFEYIADINPMRTLYDAGMYGFTSAFTMPIDDYRIAVPYNQSSHPYIEIAGDEGTQVKAISNGTVQAVGSNYIKLKMGDGIVVTYSNLREQPSLTVGSTVNQGDVIGYMGSEFLRFEVLNKDGSTTDPKVFLESTFTEAIDYNLTGEYSMKSYKQGDYPAVDGVDMKKSGCGPTSFAMVLSHGFYNKGNVSPAAVASKARSINKSLWTAAGGDHYLVDKLAVAYGITSPEHLFITKDARNYITTGAESTNINKILNAIGQNKPIIMLIHGIDSSAGDGRNSKFTSGGHFIVVDGAWDSTRAKILDPAWRDEAHKWADIRPGVDTRDSLFSGAVQAWIFHN